MATVQHRQGLRIACLEEIAWWMGYLDDDDLERLAAELSATTYGDYLRSLLTSPPDEP